MVVPIAGPSDPDAELAVEDDHDPAVCHLHLHPREPGGAESTAALRRGRPEGSADVAALLPSEVTCPQFVVQVSSASRGTGAAN